MTSPNAIAVQLAGGLGNQLFQYAAGRAASLRLNCDLLLDPSFLARQEEGHTLRPCLIGAFRVSGNVESANSQWPGWSEYHQPAYCFDPEFEKIQPGTRLFGYFQSEQFFKDYANVIRTEFCLNVPTSAHFVPAAEQIGSSRNSVSIHLRRGDYALNPETRVYHGLCDLGYYKKALRIMEGLLGCRPDYFIFTDDPYAAEELFRHIGPHHIVQSAPAHPWEDLLLMARCRHHILANSSFSWWGSWLNPLSDKIVVAPRFWVTRSALRSLNTADLYVDGTILI